jgi:hypothetical protein
VEAGGPGLKPSCDVERERLAVPAEVDAVGMDLHDRDAVGLVAFAQRREAPPSIVSTTLRRSARLE